MIKKSLAERIGARMADMRQSSDNRIDDSIVIVGKSNSERSRIKDQTIGECFVKSSIAFPILSTFGLNSASGIYNSVFDNGVEKLKSADVMAAEATIKAAQDSITFTDSPLYYLTNRADDLLDLAVITKDEWEAKAHADKLADYCGDLLNLNLDAGDIHSTMVVVGTVATYALAKYIGSRSERLTLEEQIAKYSDSERPKNESVRSLLNEQISFNMALGVSMPLNNQGDFSKASLPLLRSLDKILSIPRKSLNAIAENVLENEDDKNFFQKSLTTVYEKFFGSKELLGQHLKEDKLLNGTPLHNAIETINEVKRQSKDKQSTLSADGYTFKGNIKTIKADAMQQKLKNDVLDSLKKASSDFNSRGAFSYKLTKKETKAKKVLESIRDLHNKKVEQKFDHYEAISHVANDILNGKTKIKNEMTADQVTKLLEEKSFELSYGHFEKEFLKTKQLDINNFLNEKEESNLNRKIKGILKSNKDNIYNEDGINKAAFTKIKNDLSLFFVKHPKYLNEGTNLKDFVENIADKSMVFFQDNANRNIQKHSGTYMEFIEKRLEVNNSFLKNKDLNNDNTYAAFNSANPKKIKI